LFGYIKPYEDELKVRSLRLYRSIYCGLCKSAGKHAGMFSRFFLSYDYTFFACVRMIFEKTPYKIDDTRCGFHLFAKKKIIADNNALALSSAIFSVLTYYKILDNIKDEGFFRSLGARMLLPITSHMRKKALKNGFSDVEMVICDYLEKISTLEKSKETSSLEISEAFGEMMGYLLKLGLDEKDKQDAYTVGFETGRFIYNCDALDDMREDEKEGRFNPYINEYGSSDKAFSDISSRRNTLVYGTDVAADIISARKKDLGRSFRELCDIAQNILYFGCPAVIDGILEKALPHCDGKNRKGSTSNEQSI